MKAIKVLTVFGTRPEAIKMAPVVKELQARPGEIQLKICVTGQHREMLDQVLGLFNIQPDVDLDLMQSNQTPNQVAARVMTAIEPIYQEIQPEWVLVQGDTTTVMAASIAAHHCRIKVGHVEAGLRTYDRENPFPEEMNRVLTDHISDRHFAPTAIARDHLLQEGIRSEQVFVTGNTVIDALQIIAAQPPSRAFQELSGKIQANGKNLVLVTAHRRENFGEPLLGICQALQQIAARGDCQVIYPVHRNPSVMEPVYQNLDGLPGITLLPPVDYLTLVHLMKHSRLILTDSGGIQEEAPSLGVPVLVLRETTERPEAVQVGAARVVGTDPARIVSEADRLLTDEEAHRAMAKAINPYGDGLAARRIAEVLVHGHCEDFSPEVRQAG